MRLTSRAALVVALLALALPAAANAQAVPGTPADAVWSSNVEYLGSLKPDVGLTTGARVVGDKLYVTSGKNISIYSITDPGNPQLVGFLPNVIWENEEVATNGKLLVFSSDWYSFMPDCLKGPLGGCIQLFDVRDPANPVRVATISATNHTSECALDCQYIYGSAGTIVDARGALDGVAPKVIGNWINELKPQGVTEKSCHHIREIRPGVLLTACQPFTVISINEEDGGSPEHPKVLAKGAATKFVHSARWPRGGKDDLVMIGGEENFTGRCELNNSEFSTYSAKGVLAGTTTDFQGPLHQAEPAGNGVYADGKPVAGALGCSVHWFQEHPSFHNGGLVALSEYEDGVRFEQVGADGSITEQGFFIGAGSSSSSPKWAPDGKTVYSIDYQRGIDIIRWKGGTYVPSAATGKTKLKKGQVRGTNGSAAATRAMARLARPDQTQLLGALRAQGWFPGYCRLASQA